MLIKNLIACALFLTVISAQDLCEKSDLICNDDCSQVILRLGGDHQYTVETCDTTTGVYCYAPLKKCSSVHNSCNNSAVYPIKCNSVDMFPDPDDCKWYHICEQDTGESTPRKCEPEEKGYNALVRSCIKKIEENVGCPEPFGTCSKVGEVFVNTDNKAIYSICIFDEKRGLIHDLNECEYGDFDKTNLTCPEWDESDLS